MKNPYQSHPSLSHCSHLGSYYLDLYDSFFGLFEESPKEWDLKIGKRVE